MQKRKSINGNQLQPKTFYYFGIVVITCYKKGKMHVWHFLPPTKSTYEWKILRKNVQRIGILKCNKYNGPLSILLITINDKFKSRQRL